MNALENPKETWPVNKPVDKEGKRPSMVRGVNRGRTGRIGDGADA